MVLLRQSVTLQYQPDTGSLVSLPLGSAFTQLASGAPGILTGGTQLFAESFEDSAFASRGWYDMGGVMAVLDPVNPHSGANAARFTWQSGQALPELGWRGRIKFTPTDQVYIEYWVRYSPNYIGSGQNFHPHEWIFFTNEDGDFVAPADTHLSSYVETQYDTNGNRLVQLAGDALNIDQAQIGVDLTQVTELRGAHGCNGLLESTQSTLDCFDRGDQFVNGRAWKSGVVITDAIKTNWNKIGAFFKLNTLTGGKANLDGIQQMWLNDVLTLDFQGIVQRTGEFPNMLYQQLALVPFIGSGSPAVQSIYYDDLLIATQKP